MVTEAQVWEALAEIPDPEIPVISLVDLGVVRDVNVQDGQVRVDFTPTFLGCPALEVMRDAMADQIRALGAEPEINVRLDDSWSTDRITAAGREKLPGLRQPRLFHPDQRGAMTESAEDLLVGRQNYIRFSVGPTFRWGQLKQSR